MDLGIFEPVAGRIVLHRLQPLGRRPDRAVTRSTLVRLSPGGTANADRFASFTLPLGWSRDGTKLLFLREDPTDETFPYDRPPLHPPRGWDRDPGEPRAGQRRGDLARRVAGRLLLRDSSKGPRLYVVDAEGGEPVRIAEEGDSPTFSPDGSRSRTSACRGMARRDGREHVWVANADGTGAHEILADEPALAKGVFELTWSPAGDRIAMGNSLERHVAIYTFAPDGSDFTKVIDGGINPFWSPDGSQIAYMRPYGDTSTGAPLAIADADGSNVQVFDFGGFGPWHPGTPTT